MKILECNNLSDAIPLFLPHNLYLKPIAKLLVSVELPHFKKLIGKSVSTLEIIDKIKDLIKPHDFVHVKVVTSTISVVELEIELPTREKLSDILNKANNKVLQLKNFKHVCKVRASEWKQDYPNQEDWKTFFTNSKEMDATKPGERPDTLVISGLPITWFTHTSNDKFPSERLLFEVFLQFGKIRKVDIPICDPYRSKMKKYLTGMKTFTFGEKDFFEGYIQFYDYSSFIKAMEAFRGMKLVCKQGKTAHMVDIKVDCDKTKHMSLGFIKRRQIIRDRLRELDAENKELQKQDDHLKSQEQIRQSEPVIENNKEARKKRREERRKAKLLDKLRENSSDALNKKIAKEEYKILKAQRKLESIRLIEALFRRMNKKIDLKDKSIDDIIKEKRQLLRSSVVWSDESTSTSSEQDERESSDTTVSGTPHSKYGWYPPLFNSAYLHPGQKILNYPLLQQEEYVKYFSKFLYNQNSDYRKPTKYSRPPPPQRRYSRTGTGRNYNTYKPYRRKTKSNERRRSRSRSSSDSSSHSRSSSRRRRRSSSRNSRRSRRS